MDKKSRKMIQLTNIRNERSDIYCNITENFMSTNSN